jgi:hypothetical protein
MSNEKKRSEVVGMLAVAIEQLLDLQRKPKTDRVITTRRIIMPVSVDEEHRRYHVSVPVRGAEMVEQKVIYETFRDPDASAPPICCLLVVTSWDCPPVATSMTVVTLDDGLDDKQPHGIGDPPCA